MDVLRKAMLQRLDELKYQLPRSERRIAQTILDNPEVVSYMRLNELAQASDVSIATVHRFCRSMGCDGFKELRQEISRSMACVQQQAPSVVSNSESHNLPNIINEINQSLSSLHTVVNEVALTKTTKLLNSANRSIICSTDDDFHSTVIEGSSLLYKVGIPCEPKLTEQAIIQSVPTFKKNDLAIFIITDRSPEPLKWIGSIKQLGGNSMTFTVGTMLDQQTADVSIALERNPTNQHSQLLAQVSLMILLKHLSASVSAA